MLLNKSNYIELTFLQIGYFIKNKKTKEQEQGQSVSEKVWGLLLANTNHTSVPDK